MRPLFASANMTLIENGACAGHDACTRWRLMNANRAPCIEVDRKGTGLCKKFSANMTKLACGISAGAVSGDMLTTRLERNAGSISITDIQARLLHHSTTAKPYVTFQLGSHKVRSPARHQPWLLVLY